MMEADVGRASMYDWLGKKIVSPIVVMYFDMKPGLKKSNVPSNFINQFVSLNDIWRFGNMVFAWATISLKGII